MVSINNNIILTIKEYAINKLIKIYLRFVKRFKNVKNDIYDDRLNMGVHVYIFELLKIFDIKLITFTKILFEFCVIFIQKNIIFISLNSFAFIKIIKFLLNINLLKIDKLNKAQFKTEFP